MKPPSLLRIVLTIGTCAAITVALGTVNIWLGILSMPILYGVSQDLLNP